jgi:hypothetical protein
VQQQKGGPKERKLTNDIYDEAVEVSQSMEQSAAAPKLRVQPTAGAKGSSSNFEDRDAKGLSKTNDQSKSQSVLNKPFDEALEFSRSGSDESVDTRGSSPGHHPHKAATPAASAPAPTAAPTAAIIPQMTAAQKSAAAQLNTNDSPPVKQQVCSVFFNCF